MNRQKERLRISRGVNLECEQAVNLECEQAVSYTYNWSHLRLKPAKNAELVTIYPAAILVHVDSSITINDHRL
jgi:hypothetical protein